MRTLTFDRPEPQLTDEENEETLRAIDTGISQLDAGEGIPLDELRRELARRCSR
jgi:hypothetical protein